MCTSTIARVERDNDALRTLTWLGTSFFSNQRLARFVLDTWSQVGSPDQVNWLAAGHLTSPVVEVWTVRDRGDALIGAMSIHYYSWDRMRGQRYFVQPCAQPVNATDCLYIQPFEGLVSERTQPGASHDVAVELGYVAVSRPCRGQGIGTRLFEVFLERAQQVAFGRTLAFTIVMSRHAQSSCGQMLMSHMISAGANDPSSAVSPRDLAQPLRLPLDLLDLEPNSMPTARLALRQGFSMAGYGKNLGQLWIRDMQEMNRAHRLHVAPYPHLSLPPIHLAGSTHVSLAMP